MTYKYLGSFILLITLLVAGCRSDTYGTDDENAADTVGAPTSNTSVDAAPYGGIDTLSRDILERDRYDNSWRTFAEQEARDSARTSAARSRIAEMTLRIDTTENDETWDDITPEAVNGDSIHLPLSGEVEGPSVLRVQILLDKVYFSPGIIDGRWGKNTEKAVYWLQRREGLVATGTVDSTTLHTLLTLADSPDRFAIEHTLTEDDVAGPFVDIPGDIYAKAELDRMGYESLTEKLSEQFHATPDLLAQLNPEATLNALQAGDVLMVPAVSSPDDSTMDKVAQIAISGSGFYLHAKDSTGRILYHFPSTLGSSYDPSPEGDFEVNSVTEDPWWHYQPDILESVPDDQPDARIPPGPNNAVGVVWIDLSEPHFGIHGTSAPETIGYVTSAGCVRLTNWDALFLGRHLEEGIPVSFTGTRTQQAGG